MRLVALILLVFTIQACGVSPKDYSSASPLKPVDNQLSIRPLWIKPTGDVPENDHAQLPPVVVGKNVYIANITGKVSMLNADNGNILWTRKIGDDITGGPGAGPEMIYIGTRDAEIISINQDNGSEIWRSRISSEMLSTPIYSNGVLFVQTIDGNVTSMDASTGKINWVYSHNTPKLTLRGTATPLVVGKQVICGFADGKLVSINKDTGELNWSTGVSTQKGRTDLERLADIDGEIKAAGGSVYVINYQGQVASISIQDGNIQWSRKMSSYTGLTIDDRQIYVSDAEGNVWALDAHSGATIWRQSGLMGREISSPEISGNAVVVGDYDGYVHWLAKEDGRFIARESLSDLWEKKYPTVYETLDEELASKEYHRLVTVKPLAVGNTLFVRDNFGALVAFKVEK
jgi:outer membrane protein assembly factor BamB